MTFDDLTPEQAYEAGYRQGFRDGERSVREWWPVPAPVRPCAPRGASPRVYPLTGGASNRARGAR